MRRLQLFVLSFGCAALCSAAVDVENLVLMTDVPPGVQDDPSVPVMRAPIAGGVSGEGVRMPECRRGADLEYTLAEARIGRTFEDVPASLHLGDYLTEIPDNVDWVATVAALKASEAYGKGQVAVFASESNATKRILFTAGGTFVLPWVIEQAGVTATTNLEYSVRPLAVARPHRIFWTSYPYNGPQVSVKGKYVKLFGDPDLVKPVYEVDDSSHQSNIVRGVILETSSMTIQAIARTRPDGTTDGPKGQFVVAYYDSGDYSRVIDTTVVEVLGPEVVTRNVHVGERLTPYGGSYDINGLRAYIEKGAAQVEGDTASPYLEVFSAQSKYNAKDGAVYAIAPTDGSASSDGLASPSKAHVYWESTDRQDVLWPFEEDYYLISWNPDDPKMIVSDDPANLGIPLFLPSRYAFELSGYMKPGDCASSPSNGTVVVRQAGRFLLRLTFDDDVRYLPVHACLRTDPSVLVDRPLTMRVGQTLSPPVAAEVSSNLTAYVNLFDSSAQGYVYEAKSAKVWNPHLYHTPAYKAAVDTTVTSDDDDPFAALKSSIVLVSAIDSPDAVETWWYRSLTAASGEALPEAVEMPGLVCRTVARWPKENEVHEIALVSQKGSAASSFVLSGSAYYLYRREDGVGTTNRTYAIEAANGLSLGLWVNPGPEDAGDARCPPTTGRLMSWTLGTTGFALSATAVDAVRSRLVLSAAGTPVAEASVGSNAWAHLVFVLEPFTNGSTRVRLHVDGQLQGVPVDVSLGGSSGRLNLSGFGVGSEPGVTNGVSGWAVDTFAGWNRALTQSEIDAMRSEVEDASSLVGARLFEFPFDSFVNVWGKVPDESEACYAVDAVDANVRLPVSGSRYCMEPGAPEITEGYVPIANNCTPRIYRQTDAALPGFQLNVEHAFVKAQSATRSVVWAMRNDLDDSPYVLVEHAANGAGAMMVFHVADTNEIYHLTQSTGEVGTRLVPPKPVCELDDYWNEMNFFANEAAATSNDTDRTVVFTDRKANNWARRDGCVDAHYYYPCRIDFDLPNGTSCTLGELLPWRNGCSPKTWETDLKKRSPAAWTWLTRWPDLEKTPLMKVAQTLTEAVDGLPQVWKMASCQVVYPRADRCQTIGASPNKLPANVVDLIDPVTARTAQLPIVKSFTDEYGFKTGSSGTTQLRKGKYYFTGLPPSISGRFYVDANAVESQRMVLVGEQVKPTTGNAYLRLNVLTAQEVAALKAICVNEAPQKIAWDRAVDTLGGYGVIRPGPHQPVANYALVANGNDSGWVVLAENNSTNTDMVAKGDVIDLHVLYVTNALYAGKVTTQADSLNKLSELLTVQYNEAFGPATTNYTFEWYRVEPRSDGSVPGLGSPQAEPVNNGWDLKRQEAGLTSFTLGGKGTTLSELVNAYWTLRYRPKPGTSAYYTCGPIWSAWADEGLAEGWVQRVLNAVTPFAQRVEDFYSYPSDIAYSMLAQIGGPYAGDVALNNDNLTSVGLLELYQTIFNKAEKMSLGLDAFDPAADSAAAGVFKQLMLAATRLAELYQLLGAEAYSDAKNPLVSQGFDDQYLENLASLPSSTFCFQNQVRTLLDEELCLLRGRSAATTAPNMATTPCYNRLYWNFTKGITEGEVAYVNNYGIRGEDGVITEAYAKRQYPQGHGDAWGHYLSSMSCYYRMLRNPKFDWIAAMGEMNVGGTPVNEDYTDEQKFADSAAKLAQIGLDVVDLTARKAWRDNAGDVSAAYFDGVTDQGAKTGALHVRQGFGYGEWASRAALGGAYNWMVVNALLPTNDAPAQVYVDRGISQITRPTAIQLVEICTSVDAIQAKVNTLDAGLNPLGLSQNMVPMDIDPDALATKNSHFDQILERAEKALANCSKVLDYANLYGARLQQIQNKETSEETAAAAEEAAYNRELIAIYGTPYSGDIGTGKTYVQGYDGPDLYHYMYFDLSEYGLTEKELGDVTIGTRDYKWNTSGVTTAMRLTADVVKTLVSTQIVYRYSALGLAMRPSDFGKRLTEGSIQTAGRAYLHAYLETRNAKSKYDEKCGQYDRMRDYNTSTYGWSVGSASALAGIVDALAAVELVYRFKAKAVTNVIDIADLAKANNQIMLNGIPVVQVVGTATSVTPQALAAAALAPLLTQQLLAKTTSIKLLDTAHTVVEALQDAKTVLEANAQVSTSLKAAREDYWSEQLTYWNEMYAAYEQYSTAVAALAEADAVYRAEIAKGETLLNRRTGARKCRSNTATAYRYADMFNRVQRNNALTKYSTSFDTAQRYVWELAKVYDYETGLLSSDPQAGDAFLAEVIGSRQLGYPGVSTSSATDKGLYDIVNRMKENWSVLKGRLGVNNPENTTTEFSLRYELFRIQPGAAGDEAWRQTLRRYWVPDINSDSTFKRHCQPLETAATASVLREPGLVIPFPTSIYAAENFFGKTLQGGDSAFSSADYATKIHAIGLAFTGYDKLAADQSASGLKKTPYVYLVPAGRDYMRAPAGTTRAVLGWNVIDQVLPLPYTVGSTQLDDEDWISTMTGLDGTSDSAAKIRRHAPFRADGEIHSTRLVGRSVWNDNWVLVIPGVELNADREKGLDTFIRGVSDIKLKIKAYARQGN